MTLGDAAQAGIVIVGAGECGARAAFALRELGYPGAVTLIGAERHLPYERPPLSKAAILSADAPEPKWVRAHSAFAENAIVCATGVKAVAIDRSAKRIRIEDGVAIPYHKLLLATGATPRRLGLSPDSRRIAYLRTYDDALAIRRAFQPGVRIAIVGGGLIGLELAAAAIQRGAVVSVIEAQPRILMRGVPEAVANIVAARHREAGVVLLCGQAIRAIADDAHAITLTLSGGRLVQADVMVVSIGATPATELAQDGGLQVDSGVVVDETLTTSDPDIFAAGDCCVFPHPAYGGMRIRLESWRNAQDQGQLAARNMMGVAERVAALPWFWSDQYELTLQVVGLPEVAVTSVTRRIGDDSLLIFHLSEDDRLVAASGIGPGNAVGRDIRLAEMLIQRRARLGRAALATASVSLKSLLLSDREG